MAKLYRLSLTIKMEVIQKKIFDIILKYLTYIKRLEEKVHDVLAAK